MVYLPILNITNSNKIILPITDLNKYLRDNITLNNKYKYLKWDENSKILN